MADRILTLTPSLPDNAGLQVMHLLEQSTAVAELIAVASTQVEAHTVTAAAEAVKSLNAQAIDLMSRLEGDGRLSRAA